MAAGQAMLDEIHETLPSSTRDINTYTLGAIGSHNIGMACLPAGQYGTNNAAIVGANMLTTFPHIEKRLMVGIGGGVPDLGTDVRLGDVVVGDQVIQYDLGKVLTGGRIQSTGIPTRPPPTLLTAVSKLKANHEMAPSKILAFVGDMLERNHPNMNHYARPEAPDHLYLHTYKHVPSPGQSPDRCQACDETELKFRQPRPSNAPAIHYGGIASGNRVIKDGQTRKDMSEALNVLCFEMEAAGLMEGFSCLVIRGICDYSDSHKNKDWQEYAAATAAAYAKELLLVTTTSSVPDPETSVPKPAVDASTMWEIQKLLLDSLIFDEIESRYDTIKPALSQTCVWFPQSGNYQAWQDPAEYASHHGFLWISGKPGAGKSTMMKFLFAQMQKTSGSDPDVAVVAFFFNARGVELEKSTEGMYRSLLFHILEAFPDLACFLGFRAQQRSITWTLPKLQQAFRAVVENLGHRRLTCFIDALDECDEGQMTDMVGTLEDLGNAAFQNATQFYACLSSRHYPHVQIQPCLRTVLEQQAGHSRDIEAYVHSKLRSKTSGAAVNEVAGIILSKAAGVFIWVVLVVETLRDAFARGDVLFIKRQVQELPSELSKLFATIISRDAVNMDRFLLCVQWILFAERPLTREEFFFALHSGINPEPETLMAWNPDYITKEHMELFVLSSSKGLAELTKASVPTVQFIHESVRDFFLKDDGTEKLWSGSSQGQDFATTSHDRLRACCEFYTSVDTSTVFPARISVVDAPMAIVMPLQTAISKSFPFLEYANAYIFVHANSGSSTSTPQDEFLRRFDFSSWLRVHILFEKVGGCRHTLAAGHVYLFAENNWTELLRLALQMDLPVESPLETWKHPMLVAAAKDHESALSLLLAKAPWSRDTLGRTPLSYAVEHNFQQVVKKLLDNMPEGALEPDLSGQTSLSYAVKRGHDDLVKLLVTATSDTYTDVGDAEGRTPLSHAAELGAQGLIPLLTKLPNVDLNARDKGGRTPLAWAALSGHSGVVRLIKDLEGVVINSQDNSGRTPLLWAVLSRNVLIVEDVLSVSGVQVNLRDTNGRTALSWAAEIGNHRILTRLLMVRDIDINLCDNGGRTPLAWAAVSGDSSLITGCLLAVSGIQVNLQDSNGRTPLSLAAEFGHHRIVSSLLGARGIDVNLCDNGGRTPLAWVAASHNDSLILGCLLAVFDIQVNLQDNSGRTPLSLAAEFRHHRVVSGLLGARGIDVNLGDSSGRTPLSWAITKPSNREIVQMLLKTEGVDVNLQDRYGHSPLFWAARSSDYRMLHSLLSVPGLEIDGRDYMGRTVLCWVCSRRNLLSQHKKVRLLLSTGAIDVNSCDNTGKTALSWAANRGLYGVIEILHAVEEIDVWIPDSSGRTPLDYSRTAGMLDLSHLPKFHEKNRRDRLERLQLEGKCSEAQLPRTPVT